MNMKIITELSLFVGSTSDRLCPPIMGIHGAQSKRHRGCSWWDKDIIFTIIIIITIYVSFCIIAPLQCTYIIN